MRRPSCAFPFSRSWAKPQKQWPNQGPILGVRIKKRRVFARLDVSILQSEMQMKAETLSFQWLKGCWKTNRLHSWCYLHLTSNKSSTWPVQTCSPHKSINSAHRHQDSAAPTSNSDSVKTCVDSRTDCSFRTLIPDFTKIDHWKAWFSFLR